MASSWPRVQCSASLAGMPGWAATGWLPFSSSDSSADWTRGEAATHWKNDSMRSQSAAEAAWRQSDSAWLAGAASAASAVAGAGPLLAATAAARGDTAAWLGRAAGVIGPHSHVQVPGWAAVRSAGVADRRPQQGSSVVPPSPSSTCSATAAALGEVLCCVRRRGSSPRDSWDKPAAQGGQRRRCGEGGTTGKPQSADHSLPALVRAGQRQRASLQQQPPRVQEERIRGFAAWQRALPSAQQGWQQQRRSAACTACAKAATLALSDSGQDASRHTTQARQCLTSHMVRYSTAACGGWPHLLHTGCHPQRYESPSGMQKHRGWSPGPQARCRRRCRTGRRLSLRRRQPVRQQPASQPPVAVPPMADACKDTAWGCMRGLEAPEAMKKGTGGKPPRPQIVVNASSTLTRGGSRPAWLPAI